MLSEKIIIRCSKRYKEIIKEFMNENMINDTTELIRVSVCEYISKRKDNIKREDFYSLLKG